MADLTTAKKIYRIFNWASLAALILVIILVLRKSPPPAVPYDPAAAKRVEQKFAAADQAKAAGQPAQVQMNGTELNSYLAKNLQLQGFPHSRVPPSRPRLRLCLLQELRRAPAVQQTRIRWLLSPATTRKPSSRFSPQ